MKHSKRFISLVNEAKQHIREMDVHEVRQSIEQKKPMAIVDVREDHEWEADHIPEAIHIGKGVIERDIESHFPEQDTCLLLYCGGGFRSAIAALSLQEMGYTNAISMDGGFRAWKAMGYPVEK